MRLGRKEQSGGQEGDEPRPMGADWAADTLKARDTRSVVSEEMQEALVSYASS